jgi:S-adenosylmethionine-diacylglycerol 3-amino-3-carboxypropyl transferase
MKNTFFNKINYSACNEDSDSERKALQLTPNDTVLCITGSGARPLDLLIDKPRKIISIDFNPTQNYLLSLKLASYQALSYPEFRVFVGLDESSDRKALYGKVALRLTPEIRQYWDRHYSFIENGLLYGGTWETLLNGIRKLAFLRKGMVEKLMQAPSLEQQRDYWNQHWDNAFWRVFLKLMGSRFLWTQIIREPGALLIPRVFSIPDYMHARLRHLANHHLLRENHFANLLFYGRYRKDCVLPIHLRAETFDIIRERASTIEIMTGSLADQLANKPQVEQITAYSLSDFSSYADEAMYTDIWQRIAENAPDQARFCERQFLVKRIPETIHPRIVRNPALEAELEHNDGCAIYSFCVGQIL